MKEQIFRFSSFFPGYFSSLEASCNYRCSFHRRCTVCRKKRSIRTNSFFEKYPKIPLGELIVLIYFWSQDEQRRRAARMMSLSENLVCRVFRSLEDICSADIERNPFIPFPGTAVVKCDESKFNHKAKVKYFLIAETICSCAIIGP